MWLWSLACTTEQALPSGFPCLEGKAACPQTQCKGMLIFSLFLMESYLSPAKHRYLGWMAWLWGCVECGSSQTEPFQVCVGWGENLAKCEFRVLKHLMCFCGTSTFFLVFGPIVVMTLLPSFLCPWEVSLIWMSLFGKGWKLNLCSINFLFLLFF